MYPVGRGRGDLLKYSLRSLYEASAGVALPYVLLVGELPEYIDPRTVNHAPILQGSDRFVNVWRAWQKAAAEAEGREWWWLNDDFMLTGTLAEALVDTHRGCLRGFCDSLSRLGGIAMYRRRAEAAMGVLQAEGYASPDNWEAHNPIRANGYLVSAVAAMCRRHDLTPDQVAVRTMIATIDERAGLPVADPKIDHPREHRLPHPVASIGPKGWRTTAGRTVRDRWPEPSPWERQ